MPSHANEYSYEGSNIDGQTVTTTTTTILAANPQRRAAVLVNTGATDLYLAIGRAAEAGKGICLKATGGSYEINCTNLTHAAIDAITASGTTTMSIHEGI
jgi:hypothetical protein